MVNNVRVLNIRECLLHDGGDVLGEDEIQNILSDFYCELNPDVERFLKEQAVDFTKKQQSVTYVILDEDTASSLGYFTLAIKPLSVTLDDFSNTMKKRIARVSKIDKNTGKYTFSAYLIAQLARNFSPRLKRRFSGRDVLEVAIQQIKKIMYPPLFVVWSPLQHFLWSVLLYHFLWFATTLCVVIPITNFVVLL